MTATASNATASASGAIVIDAPMKVSLAGSAAGQLSIGWLGGAATVLEESSSLGAGATWVAVTNPPVMGGNGVNLPVSANGSKFYRVRQAW